jgi:thymidine phosphorylase
MLVTDIIRRKRDGGRLDREQVEQFVAGLADESIPAEQVSALAMAIFLNSMDFEEAGWLTTAMAASGRVLAWDSDAMGGPVIDKHSTGGVGDKVSFLLAPIAAACGCFVPMISGRGLGHTGGTLDKIECIPGYRPTPDLDEFRKVVRDVGCAIIGQTRDLAPADRRFYAIRDITATVESIPLITASILSKKIAAGNDFLVMDVKWGTGAFMNSFDDARALAESIIGTASNAGLATHALITDMNEVLGTTAGHATEMRECVEYLTGDARDGRLDEVVLGLAAEMLAMTGLAEDRDEARATAESALTSGRAAEVFQEMATALGGPWDFVEKYDRYIPTAPVIEPVLAPTEGTLARVDARAIGNAIIELGGGRRRTSDAIDLRVGFSDVLPVGAAVNESRPLAMVHARTADEAAQAARRYAQACEIATGAVTPRPVIAEILTRA